MGLAKLNIWVSNVADPCGTWTGEGLATVLDCKGILNWPCGRFLNPSGSWENVPNGVYRNLPFRCGHLEVELPPGCYWVICGNVTPEPDHIHLNYTTHVGVVEVGCDQCACVKLYNPTLRLCWNWFLAGLRMVATVGGAGAIDRAKLEEVEKAVEELLRPAPHLPVERLVERLFEDLVETAAQRSAGAQGPGRGGRG